ncbi:Uncharacterised protein [uncultured archaeon]|nr:Uncharacterised protein [uncultured archaeon]
MRVFVYAEHFMYTEARQRLEEITDSGKVYVTELEPKDTLAANCPVCVDFSILLPIPEKLQPVSPLSKPPFVACSVTTG